MQLTLNGETELIEIYVWTEVLDLMFETDKMEGRTKIIEIIVEGVLTDVITTRSAHPDADADGDVDDGEGEADPDYADEGEGESEYVNANYGTLIHNVCSVLSLLFKFKLNQPC